MRFEGKPNETIITTIKRGRKILRKVVGIFDENGLLDVENPEFIKKMIAAGYKTIEIPFSEPKTIACKTCGAEFTNMGDFLTHCRAHKAVKS